MNDENKPITDDKALKPTDEKAPKPRRSRKKYIKKENALSQYMFMNSWRMDEASTSFIELLCGKMLEYFADKEKLCVEEFLVEEGLRAQTFHRWLAKHDNLREVYGHIKMILAVRREKGILRGELKEKCGMYMQHQYSENWDEANKYWSKLNKKNELEGSGTTNVYLPRLDDDREFDTADYELLDNSARKEDKDNC